MDRIVTLKLRSVSGQDSYGEETETFSEVPIWAERMSFQGAERFIAEQRLATQSAVYVTHYREDVNTDDKLVDGSDTFDIHAVLPIGRREGLRLVCLHTEAA